MRFTANGPNFPDELLVARDEGRVVFFCGAGVSRAKAGLRDFVGLAQDVADRLSIPTDNPARLLIKAMDEFPSIPGVGSLIAADRVFGLIERDYQSRDIHRAIAASLKPGDAPDLSAHRVLLDLAKGPDGIVRLITTNFDLLFEDCDQTIPVSQQPRLPDPLRSQDFRGIIHLHGLVTPDYSDAAGEGLIISSGEFGRAYLSDRWATDFIKTVLERFFVVFVGYSADDPPMQYLLEALNRSPGSFSGAYALQSGSFEDAEARWVQKGVKPIVYDSADQHARLWDSLDLWGERARRPTEWHTALLQKAMIGPERCDPYIRGQIAHLASTLDGSKRIAQAGGTLPAEWLCTFDPRIRLAEPNRIGRLTEPGPYFFPFAAYGLDSDPAPPNVDPEEDSIFQKYEIPSNAWNAFQLTRADRQDLQEDQVSSLRGHWAVNVPQLSPRAAHLGHWLQKVAHQPVALWWAARQHGVHPDIQRRIEYGMDRADSGSSPMTRKAWRYLIRSWRAGSDDDHSPDYFQLLEAIKLDGWSHEMVREYARVHEPFVKAGREYSSSPRPPDKLPEDLSELMHLDVKYPNHNEELSLPDSLLPAFVRASRLNLELGAALENDLGAYGLHSLDPVEGDEEADHSDRDYRYGINIPLFAYLKCFHRLLDLNTAAAQLEAFTWRNADGPIAAHFKIWSCSDSRLVSGREIALVLKSISREDFWAGSHQRDLLLALKKRWQEIPSAAKRSIERRLLQGRKRQKRESTKEYRESKASAILGRIHYLHLGGCEFSFDIEAVTRQLRADYPDWKPEWASKAAFSMAMRTGWVTTDKNSDDLQKTPLNEILDTAAKLSGRSSDEMFLERDPYGGLCEAKPVRAFAALSVAAKEGKYPENSWRTFLNSENSKRDRARFIALIAGRLSRLPDSVLAKLIRPVSDWMLRTYKTLLTSHRDVLDRLWVRVVETIKRPDTSAESSVIRTNQQPDWATDALNSPVGYLAQVLMGDPSIKGLKSGSCFPAWWKERADELLSLSGNHRRHALAIFCHNLVWLFFADPDWVVKKFLPAMERNDADSDAFWAGFFWGAKVPQRDLYLRMKPALLRLAHRESETRRKHAEILAGLILAGWGRKKDDDEARLITDNELTATLLNADDDFRVQLLWHLQNWTKQPESDWADDAAVLMKQVWPKQIAVKTPRVSAKLVELAFAQGDRFPIVAEYVLPLLVPIDQDYIHLPVGRTDSDLLVETYPGQTLALLDAVLTDNARQWPYGVSEILDRIAKAEPLLLTDIRLIRLNRVRSSS